jgi:hypothetical protein
MLFIIDNFKLFFQSLEDEYLVSTFDVNEFQFEVKEDLFGIGYKRLDVSAFFGGNSAPEESPAASLLFPMMNNNQKKINKRGISGQAFGVGEYEDEEDVDVYQQDSMEKYDFGLDNKKQHKEAQKILNKSYGFGAFDDDVSIMKKFALSKKKQEPAKVFPAPQVPANFNLRHKFPENNDEPKDVLAIEGGKHDSMNTYLKSVSERSNLLGEEVIKPDSVFDLISPADREFLKQQKMKNEEKPVVEKNEKLPVADQSTSQSREKAKEIDKEKKMKRYQEFKSFVLKNFKGEILFQNIFQNINFVEFLFSTRFALILSMLIAVLNFNNKN